MSATTVIRNATLINEGRRFISDVLLKEGVISRVDGAIEVKERAKEIDATGLFLLPGVIDDQVHFREPGLTHKGNIYTESRAAVAGGVTSFMEMPNTVPNTLTQQLLENKYAIAAASSLANYSFFMGVSNDNLDEVLKTSAKDVCGIKIFMGSSTGNMLVDDVSILEKIFSESPMLIATHCEDESTIKANLEEAKKKYGDDISPYMHPDIRSRQACFLSSSFAVALARKHNTRLHILHISTEDEIALFENETPLKEKRITAEVCIHHLWFSDTDYERLGNLIKWNPAVKKGSDRDALLKGLLDDKLDVIATDHAPHTLEEKQQPYLKSPSGGPLVQHSLIAMLELHHKGKISLERIVEKMCHAPALCFNINNRGYLREGYAADCVLVNLNDPFTVSKNNIYYKCAWSPFEGQTFQSKVISTYVNGVCVFENGRFNEQQMGQRLQFNK